MVTTIDLTLDRRTHDVARAEARLVVVDPRRFKPDPAVQRYVDEIDREAAPYTRRKVGVIHGELTALPNPAGQSALGQFVADAQLAAMREAGAQVALANAGGQRASLAGRRDDADAVTLGDLHATQPFGNTLIAMTVSGAQLLRLLEQQWHAWTPADRPRLLAVSRGFEYAWNGACPRGHRIVPHSVRIGGREVVPNGRYRIAERFPRRRRRGTQRPSAGNRTHRGSHGYHGARTPCRVTRHDGRRARRSRDARRRAL